MATLPNYVKFQRGIKTVYQSLKTNGLIDNDTLYFIYDTDSSSSGSLYLGTKLISGVSSDGTAPTSLAELSDIIIKNAGAGDFLVQSSDGNWKNLSATEVASTILSAGGQFVNIDSKQFEFITQNDTSNVLSLAGFSEAESGTVPLKSVDGKITWSKPVDSTITSRVETLESTVANIDQNIATAISNANHLTYKKVSSLSDMTSVNVIYLMQDDNSTDSSDKFKEFMIVDGQLEKLGSFEANLSDYATKLDLNSKADLSALTAIDGRLTALENNSTFVLKSTFDTVVGDISSLNSHTDKTNITDDLIELYDRLTWSEMAE